VSSDSGSSWRIFCAIEFPDELVKRVEQHIARLRQTVPEVAASWSRSFHLTIRFSTPKAFTNPSLGQRPREPKTIKTKR
jgi:hypothetical protein